ncbi:MAG: CBS domain-containing protein [Gammaproteobacteria bacterium]|nr:CBS domain-containing protein [Gammaproteobacteria bacterium]
MNAGELCNRDVVTATADMTILDAARLMRDQHVGCLVVIATKDDRIEPVGMLTDRDIVIEIIAEGVDINQVTVGDVMTFAVLKVPEDESIFDTAQRMRARGVRRVPIVSSTCSLVGILAFDDILEMLSEELSVLSRLTSREAEQETRKRALPC